RGRIDLPGEKAAAERAERDKTDAQFLEYRKHLAFRFAPPQRILVLQRRDRLHGMSATNRGDAGLRQAEMLHFSFADEIANRARDILDRNVGIDAMLVEKIDGVGPEAAQRRFGHLANMSRTAVESLPAFSLRPDPKTELRGDDHAAAERSQ